MKMELAGEEEIYIYPACKNAIIAMVTNFQRSGYCVGTTFEKVSCGYIYKFFYLPFQQADLQPQGTNLKWHCIMAFDEDKEVALLKCFNFAGDLLIDLLNWRHN